jgi:hypothetical protein
MSEEEEEEEEQEDSKDMPKAKVVLEHCKS